MTYHQEGQREDCVQRVDLDVGRDFREDSRVKLNNSRMNVEAAVVDIRVKILVHADGGSEGN